MPTLSIAGPCLLSLSGMAKIGGGAQPSESAQHRKTGTEPDSGLSRGGGFWLSFRTGDKLFYFWEPPLPYLSNGSNGDLGHFALCHDEELARATEGRVVLISLPSWRVQLIMARRHDSGA